MPHRRSCALSVFQCLINDVLRDFLGNFVIDYIDGILIYSPSIKRHVDHVRQVLFKLRENQFYVKGEKYKFHCTTVSFLGYVISKEGITRDNEKVKSSDRLAHSTHSQGPAMQSLGGIKPRKKDSVCSSRVLTQCPSCTTQSLKDPSW